MAAIWNDFLNASKSGAETGLALARILNEKGESSRKLDQAEQAESDQTGLGYAGINARQQEAGQSAAEKLQAAMASQAALNNWRNQNLDLKTGAAESLNDYRNSRLSQADTRIDQGQQKIDQSGERMDARAKQNAAANALKEKAANALATRHDLTDSQRLVLAGAIHSTSQAQSVLLNGSDAQQGSASNLLNQASAVIQSLTGQQVPAAAALAKPAAATTPATATGTTPDAASANYNLFAPQSTATGDTSAAAALTPASQPLFQNDAPNTQAAPAARVKVKSPDGKTGSIPAEQLDDAIANGYEQVQ